MPSYNHPNKPVPIYKKAIDHVNLMRHSYELADTSNNKLNLNNIFPSSPSKPQISNVYDIPNSNNKYKTDPLTLPYSDYRYNKYIDREFNKLKKVYENSNLINNIT